MVAKILLCLVLLLVWYLFGCFSNTSSSSSLLLTRLITSSLHSGELTLPEVEEQLDVEDLILSLDFSLIRSDRGKFKLDFEVCLEDTAENNGGKNTSVSSSSSGSLPSPGFHGKDATKLFTKFGQDNFRGVAKQCFD
jgi:hypothetical protein